LQAGQLGRQNSQSIFEVLSTVNIKIGSFRRYAVYSGTYGYKQFGGTTEHIVTPRKKTPSIGLYSSCAGLIQPTPCFGVWFLWFGREICFVNLFSLFDTFACAFRSNLTADILNTKMYAAFWILNSAYFSTI